MPFRLVASSVPLQAVGQVNCCNLLASSSVLQNTFDTRPGSNDYEVQTGDHVCVLSLQLLQTI